MNNNAINNNMNMNNAQYSDVNNNMNNNQMNYMNSNMNNSINMNNGMPNGNNYPMNNYQNGMLNGNEIQNNYQNNIMNNNMNMIGTTQPVEDPMDEEVKRILEISEISERCERIKSILYRELNTFEENELPDAFNILKFIMKFTKLQDELFKMDNNINIMKIPTKFLNIYYPEYYEKIIVSIIKIGMEFLKSRNLDLDGLFRQRNDFIKMIMSIEEHLKSQKYLTIPNIVMALNVTDEEKKEIENLVKALNATLTLSNKEATHKIYPSIKSEATKIEYRIINKLNDNNVVIHCLEHPDSYNKIVKASPEYENCDFNENNDYLWNVSINWLRNCLKFRDWISEQDFVVDKQEIDDEKERRLNKYPETVEEARDYLINQSKKIIIPEYAKWFSFLKIDDREKKALPEFFNNKSRSKTEEIYKEYRNFIVNTYRMNPSEYLTVTSCRRFLAGDINSIMRIHSFLEQWGLINYQINPETRPSKIGPSFTGHFRITANTPKGLVPFFPNIPASIATLNDDKEQGQKTNINKNNKKVFCSTCKSECTQKRYHCLTQRSINLCPNCYSEGIFPVDLTSSNFIKLENTIIDQEIDDRWTDQEILLLLEGIELYDDEWMKIAEYVGTKSHRQCISKFLELPIEDPFLENNDLQDSLEKLNSEPSINETKSSSTTANIGPMKYSRIPFNQADNPVLSVVTFLAAIADPKATKVAVKAAVEELENPNSLKKYIQNYKESILKKDNLLIKKDEEEKVQDDEKLAESKTKLKSTKEEIETQKMLNKLIELKLKKFELKFKNFELLEKKVENEKKEFERQYQNLYIDKLVFKRHIQQKIGNEAKRPKLY